MIYRSIESCIAQSFGDFEIVVVDDGSTDNTEETLNKYTDDRIVYIKQANAGASAARNTGAEHAKGKYLAFLDSDDEFLPGKLSAFNDTISQFDSQDTVFYFPLHFHRCAGNRLRKPNRAIAKNESVGDYLFADDGMMQTSTLVIPSSCSSVSASTLACATWRISTSACASKRRGRGSTCCPTRKLSGMTRPPMAA